MPITQLFPRNKIIPLSGNYCSSITKDAIDWSDADALTKEFRDFLIANKMGESLGYVLDKESIEKLLNQGGKSLDAIKIYIALSKEDNTFRLVIVGSEFDALKDDYNDYQLDAIKPSDTRSLPAIANPRPCPPQCGKSNFLNENHT